LRKCKDKDCGWVQWPPREKSQQQTPKTREAKWTWATLNRTYGRCLLLAEQQLKASTERIKPSGLWYSPSDMLAAAATIFIAASRDGVTDEPKPAPKHDPIPEPVYADAEPDDELGDVPF
jgi:hypothetical protein